MSVVKSLQDKARDELEESLTQSFSKWGMKRNNYFDKIVCDLVLQNWYNNNQISVESAVDFFMKNDSLVRSYFIKYEKTRKWNKEVKEIVDEV